MTSGATDPSATNPSATDLTPLFDPASIAIIGASADPESISGRPLGILLGHGYRGRVYPVNPRHEELSGLRCYPDVASVPGPIDVALVVVNASHVVPVLTACATAGVRFAVVISSGFAEQADADPAVQRATQQLADRGPMRICGPNSEGLISVHDRVPLGFSPAIDYTRGLERLIAGHVSVVAQSGALAFAMFNDGQRRGLGFSCVVSTGNELDLEVLDYVEHLLDDPRTRVILMFVEGLRRGRRLAPVAARALQAGKPIVVAKVGRSPAAQRAAVSHTAHLAGDDGAYQALFERNGVTQARDQQEMVDLAMAFSRCALPAGDRIGIVTLSGGAGTWLADALADEGLQVPILNERTQRRVRELIPPYGSSANPIDVTAQVVGAEGALSELIELALHSAQLDAVVLITTLTGTRLLDRDRLEPLLKAADKPLLIYSYSPATSDSVELMAQLGLAWYTSPRRVARVLRALVDYAHIRTAPRPPAPTDQGSRPPERVRTEDDKPLLEHESKRLLARWGLTVPKGTFVTSVDELHGAARTLAAPLCLKAQSPALIHKSDAGGVALDLAGADAVVAAASAMRGRLAVAPDGFLVEQMAAPGVEMIAGALVDPDLGPFVLAGTGGIYAEILQDVSLRPAPVSEEQALELIDGLRGAALLSGARGGPRADRIAFAGCLVALGRFIVCHEDQVREIDLNPVLVGPEGRGACVVDAAIILR